MTEIGTVQVTDMLGLYGRLKNYRREVVSLEEALTNPRRKFDCWSEQCRQRRLDKLNMELIPRLQAMFQGA